MKNFDLEKKLKAARVPERPDAYWETFPRRVTTRLRTARSEDRSAWPTQPRLAWGLGIAFACLIIGFAVGQWHSRVRKTDSFAELQNGKILREVLALFPNRVRAIVQDEQGLRLVLSDAPNVPESPPLWVKICDGKQCRTVVTFSGQDLQIAGEKVEVLADAQGQVMLVGDRLFWSGDESKLASDHLRIQARALACKL
jgi:hypothetical protein